MENRLDICIAAFRRKGLEMISHLSHPRVDGVRYIVGWQFDEDDPDDIPPMLLEREDFIILPTATKGSGANRRVSLAAASAPLVLISDDDVSYEAQQIEGVIGAFDSRPDSDFLIFRYDSESNPENFPDHEFDFQDQPKGFTFGGPVIAFRLESVRRAGLDFNPLFGVGSDFCTGEDSLFVYDMVGAKLRGKYVPLSVCSHESASTSMKKGDTPEFIRAKGAFFRLVFPKTWILRMITHSLRYRGGKTMGRRGYVLAWLRGARDIKANRRSH